MVCLEVLTAIAPTSPRPRLLDDFLLRMPAKPEEWRWEDVASDEVGRDIIACLQAENISPPYRFELPNGLGVARLTPP
jgi:hypothetical protein